MMCYVVPLFLSLSHHLLSSSVDMTSYLTQVLLAMLFRCRANEVESENVISLNSLGFLSGKVPLISFVYFPARVQLHLVLQLRVCCKHSVVCKQAVNRDVTRT